MSLFKKLFGRLKKEKEEREEVKEETEVIVKKEEVEEEREKPSEVVVRKRVIERIPPFKERLAQILSSENVTKPALDVGDILIQLIAGKESICIKSVGRVGAKKLEIYEGRASNPDIFIRISESAALDLAKTKSYEEFVSLLKEIIKNGSREKYVKVNCLKSIDELRSKGYLLVDLLKIFAMA